jgi:hypothetical protein
MQQAATPPTNAPCLVGEAARIVGRSERTVRQWGDTGRVRCWRTAIGVRVFDRLELRRLAEQPTTENTTPGGANLRA